METMKVFVENGQWVYELNSSEGASMLRMKGPVTDTSNLPAPTGSNIDNTNVLCIFSGPWVHIANQAWTAPFNNNSYSYTQGVGAQVVIPFTGTKIEFYSEKRNNHGIVALSIDNGAEEMIDCYDPQSTTNNSTKVWEKTIPAGSHSFKMRYTGNKHASATEANILFDYIKVFA